MEKAASREEISATYNAALRMEKDRWEKLLKEKDAELDELRALLRSKPTSAPASAPAPPALAPAPADQALAYASKASWPVASRLDRVSKIHLPHLIFGYTVEAADF